MLLYALIAAPLLLYVLWNLVQMEIRYRKALPMGIPLIRLPIDPLNPLWLVLGPIIWDLLDKLPFSYGNFKYSRRGWYFYDKADTFLKLGPIWGFVTPNDVYLHVADADAIQQIYSRRLDFIRPTWLYTVLDIYGPCISTANAVNWPRHRKVVASPFTEGLMISVWKETIEQSKELLHNWADAGCSSYSKDVRGLSLNILAASGFRRPLEFEDTGASKRQGVDLQGYRNALETVLDNAIWLMVIPYQYLASSWLPQSWRRIGEAGIEFKRYMEIMLDQAFQAEKRGGDIEKNMMSSFVRAIDASGSGKTLTMDEIFGNIFAINFAGHDPTANTITFLILLLAIHPEIQSWMVEEIAKVYSDTASPCDYDQFSKLIRCQAILLETIRLYPSHPQIPKWTSDQPQKLRVATKDYLIPARTGVMLGCLAMHTMPKYWPNPMEWNPKRWIISSVEATPKQQPSSSPPESLRSPQPMTFIAWSNGPQSCPAEKFTKVEAIAALVGLFRQHQVQVIGEPGESEQQTLSRAQATLDDCDSKLITRMRHAHKIKLKWTRRV